MKRIVLGLGVFCCALFSRAGEPHVDYVVDEVLKIVEAVKKADPKAVPMMFWDFDGTIIKGDVSVGLSDGKGGFLYPGLAELTVKAGLSKIVKPEEFKHFIEVVYPKMCDYGVWLGYPFIAQLNAGFEEKKIAAFAKAKFEKVMKPWIFASSAEIYTRLQKAGVMMQVISASPEVYVAAAAETLGIPKAQVTGIRLENDAGIISTRMVYPLSDGNGKAEYVRRIVSAVPHAVAVAGFGNSYHTDGAFLRYIVQTTLPGGVKPFALMINNSNPPEEYKGLFYTVKQEQTISGK